VNQASSSTVLVSSVNPSVYGQAVTFTATVSAVSPGSGTPTGTVTLYDGTTKLGTATLSAGAAGFTTSTLSVGTHPIKAVYGGDTNFKTSTSAILSQVVQSAPAAAVNARTKGSTSTTTDATAAMGSTVTTNSTAATMVSMATTDPPAAATGSAPTVSSMAIAAATAVDLAIAALQDELPTSSSVHDLALDQVSTKARRWSVNPSA
jgi:hypothetical protein